MRAARLGAMIALGLGVTLATTAPALGAGMGARQVALGQSGEREAITPLSLTDDVEGYDIDEGKRVACLRVKVRNVGPRKFSDFIGNGARLRLRGGVVERPSITGGGLCKSSGTITLKKGKSTTVKLPFVINANARIIGFEYTASSGFGTNTPVWRF